MVGRVVGRVLVSRSRTFFLRREFSRRDTLSSHCSARGSFAKLHLCSVTLSAVQTCSGESTASSLNFIIKKKETNKRRKHRIRGRKEEKMEVARGAITNVTRLCFM